AERLHRELDAMTPAAAAHDAPPRPRIVALERVALPAVLEVLDQSLGPGHDPAWFAWKHVENPFGPSWGWAALDGERVVGVRLFMRWGLRRGGRDLEAARPVDTATAPEARGRGVFRELT